jgi:flagellar basal-body rod protein FlgC
MSDFTTSLAVSASGMKAQSLRMRVIAENLANASSTAETPDGLPYRRKVVSFEAEMDKARGASMVKIDKIERDPSDFRRVYNPGHPSADGDGYVKMPNVNSIVESMDMREAQRSYEANLNAIETARTMLARVIDILRS